MKKPEMNAPNFADKLIEDRRISTSLILASFVVVGVAQALVFLVVPNERYMGAVQRIFYFHVGAAIATYVMIAVLLLASLTYLATRSGLWDKVAEGAAAVGFMFCSVVLVSGMIWGHSAWNTWWRWEPRLASFLVLWLLFFGYVILRRLTMMSERQSQYAAVLGILIAVQVPLVIFSIKLLPHTEQLHPEVLPNQGLRDPRYVYALIVSTIGLVLMACTLCWVKLRNLLLAQRLVTCFRHYRIAEE